MSSLPARTVVIVTDHAHVNGGFARTAVESAIGLAHRGYAVVLFAVEGPPEPRLEAAGVRTVCLGQPDLIGDPNRLRAAIRGMWNGAAFRALRAELSRYDAGRTIVHVHSWAKALSPSVGRAVSGSGLPWVMSAQEYFLACPNGAFLNYGTTRVCKLRPLSMACVTTDCDSRRYAHKLWRVARQVMVHGPGGLPRDLTDLIYVSRTQRQALEPYLPDHIRLHELPNPIAIEQRPRVPVERNNALVFVGRLESQKGPDLLARAAVAAGRQAIFVGDGPMRARLAEIDPEAEITGWLPTDQVDARLAEARALVFPSLWYEAQPLVPLEALARGVPVIVSNVSAAVESVQDGETGQVFDPHLEGDLDGAIARIADDATCRAMSMAAYDRFWSRPPTLDLHVDRLEAIYAQIAGW